MVIIQERDVTPGPSNGNWGDEKQNPGTINYKNSPKFLSLWVAIFIIQSLSSLLFLYISHIEDIARLVCKVDAL
jgi:hypothetical protein